MCLLIKLDLLVHLNVSAHIFCVLMKNQWIIIWTKIHVSKKHELMHMEIKYIYININISKK